MAKENVEVSPRPEPSEWQGVTQPTNNPFRGTAKETQQHPAPKSHCPTWSLVAQKRGLDSTGQGALAARLMPWRLHPQGQCKYKWGKTLWLAQKKDWETWITGKITSSAWKRWRNLPCKCLSTISCVFTRNSNEFHRWVKSHNVEALS